jgi:opacity protein-like surface antigen
MNSHVRFCLLIVGLFSYVSSTLHAQTLQLGLLGGGANYQGELQDKYINLDGISATVGVSVFYSPQPRFNLSAEIMRGTLTGSDAVPGARNAARNLQFVTRLYELSVQGRFNLIVNDEALIIPYASAGVSGFHIDPYTPAEGGRIYLFPLGTEGQGLREYPDRKMNRNINAALLGGGGVEIRLSDNLNLDFELVFRKTFTDYIDDVSSTYPDAMALLKARGPIALRYAYRGSAPEVPVGTQRGNPGTNDMYHVIAFRLRYTLSSNNLRPVYGRSLFRKRGWPYTR